MRKISRLVTITFSASMCYSLYLYAEGSSESAIARQISASDQAQIEQGRLMYQEGELPSGDTIRALIKGDIELSGEQVICGSCHRRSGLGSSEGQEVVPPVTGDILYAPLRLPVSKPPLPPELRPAYTDESLKRAIRDGMGATGVELTGFMPRYLLSDQQLDSLLSYLKSLNTDPDPGVTGQDIHFATIIADTVAPATRKALLDVLRTYFEQKNTETRYESKRAEHGPWHKDWLYKPYRKWILHTWELKGLPASWPQQLQQHYREQPVFAVLSGIVPGSWQPIHDFCERNQIPGLFPITTLPASGEQGFYTIYLNRGMELEAEAVVQHLADTNQLGRRLVQVYRQDDPEGQAAAAALSLALEPLDRNITDITLNSGESDFTTRLSDKGENTIAILWLRESDIELWWQRSEGGVELVYLSSTLYADAASVPESMRNKVYFVQTSELPAGLPRLLGRSNGWLRSKRIYNGDERETQADAFFTVRMAATALKGVGAYFKRDYFLERIEHLVDNATYTSIYPRISLAPNQRFVSKGVYIAQMPEGSSSELVPVTDWLIPRGR